MSPQPSTDLLALGGDGEALAIRGSARRLLRRVLEGKLKTATGGEYDRARDDLILYTRDARTSPSERRKALQALLTDEAAGVVAARAALGESEVHNDNRTQIVLGSDAVEALARLQSSPAGRAALTDRLAEVMNAPEPDEGHGTNGNGATNGRHPVSSIHP